MSRAHACLLALAALLALAGGCGGDPEDEGRSASGESPRLFLAGDGELWAVDVSEERVQHVELTELSPGDPPHRIVRRGDRLALWGLHHVRAGPGAGGRPADDRARLLDLHPERTWEPRLGRLPRPREPRDRARV